LPVKSIDVYIDDVFLPTDISSLSSGQAE
jgi:hypothetical protein